MSCGWKEKWGRGGSTQRAEDKAKEENQNEKRSQS